VAKKHEQPAKEAPETQPAKTVTLTVKDRLLFFEFFPERSSLVNQMIVEDINEKIKIGADEKKTINLRPQGQGGLVWDEGKAKDIDIVFTGVEVDFLKSQIERLEKAMGFTLDMAKIARKIKALG